MTVDELKKELDGMKGDLEVCVFADHGQSTMRASGVQVVKIESSESDEYMMEAADKDDLDPDCTYVDFCEIG